jgi:hypothetical protein
MPDALLWWSEYCPPKGGSDEPPIQIVLQQKHFEDKKLFHPNKEVVIIAATKLPNKRYINWNKEFLEEVKNKGMKEQEYLEALQSLDNEDEKKDSTLCSVSHL